MLPTSTKITLAVKTRSNSKQEAVVVFVPQAIKPAEGAATAEVCGEEVSNAVVRLINAQIHHGKLREVAFDLIDGSPPRKVFVIGLGKPSNLTLEALRQASASATKALMKHQCHEAEFILPTIEDFDDDLTAEAIVIGAFLAAFEYQEYKGQAPRKDNDAPKDRGLAMTLLCSEAQLPIVKAAAEQGRIVSDAQNFSRTIASRPGNDINPPALAQVAQAMAKEAGLGFKVLDERQMAALGMGGILAVGAGSIATPPRMIVLEHSASVAKKQPGKSSRAKAVAPLLIVGKAITFDTGGISIKPADKMGKMIFDKCGGMAVLGLMYAIARLKLPIPVIGILASAENAISSRAYRPGDILRMYNGVTVEVTNTDAEGRLVLADALAWGIETYKPSAVIDLATLTGGVIVALGRNIAGIMGNSDELVEELRQASELAGEKIWRLPLGEEHRDQIRSDPADIVNSAGREGHPLQGGAFLSYFVPNDNSIPWAHLDIAGVADTEKDLPCYCKGATGWGVRTLVNWVQMRQEMTA